MAFPEDLEIEIAFNNDIDETDYAQSGWTSILPFVGSFSGDLRGREYELNQTEAGTVSVVLDNSDGRFLPGSVQSPYYPYVKSDRRFRIRGKNMVHPNVARGGSRDRNLTGFITDAPQKVGTPAGADVYTADVYAMDSVRIITASAEPNAGIGEGKEKLNDGLASTKWTINTQAGSVTYQLAVGVRITRYTLTIPAGNSTRNPDDWTLQGSNNGSSWTTLHTVTGNTWTEDYESQEFTVTSPNFYTYYKLDITGNVGAVSNTQLAEFKINYDDAATDLLLVDQDLTHFVEIRKAAGQTVTGHFHRTIAWFIPLEYGVRLSHSAYLWRISGTEPSGTMLRINVAYYDSALNEVNPSLDANYTLTTLPITTTPFQMGVSHTPPADAKYGILAVEIYIPSTNGTDLVYGLTGIQSELPANLAPDISGFRDQYNWQVEGDGDGDYVNVGSDPATSYLSVEWGVNDVNIYTVIPHLIPGEWYTASAEAKVLGEQPDVMFTGDEGETGSLITNPNRITNFGFETNTTGYTSQDGSIARSTAQFHSGVASVLLTPNGSGATPRVAGTSAEQTAVTVGQSVVAKAWVRRTTTNFPVRVGIDWYNSGSSYLSSSLGTSTATTVNTWQKLSLTATAPASAAFARIRVDIVGGVPAAGDTVYADDLQLYTNNAFTQVTTSFEATQSEQELRFILQGTPVVDEGLQIRKLIVNRGENLTLTLPADGVRPDNTAWVRPKDIFEGWIESWPAVAGSTELTITVVDRMKRLGEVELANTLREALLKDRPAMLLPLTDSMIDTPGRFSQLGYWSELEGGPSYVDIGYTRGDLGTSTYTTSTDDGPTGEASFKNNPQAAGVNGVGYLFNMPYSKDYTPPVVPPPTKPKPRPAPVKPKPNAPTSKQTYTKKWYATWSRSYEGDNSTRFDDSDYMYQGSYDGSSPGNQKSLAGFDYKNIMQTLKGAEILEVSITVKNQHARWNKGLYAQIGSHNYSSKPSTWSGGTVRERRWRKWVTEGGSVTVNAGTTFGNELKAGSQKGIAIGPEASNDHDHYGFFRGATQSGKPFITIKYRK